MKTYILIFFQVLFLSSNCQDLLTVFEKSNGKETPTYFQIIDFYKKMDIASGRLQVQAMGMTDAGYPLHLAIVTNDGKFNAAQWRQQKKIVIFINNGIHPGEPDGIDASMLLVRDIITGKKKIPNHLVLAFIPVYNIGGCLNRSKYYRVDQNGPEAFGSRGNSQNLDLNRDFIKCDSKEAQTFTKIFHYLKPDIFIDNHVSNGADYQHIMTLISSQHSKLGGVMGEYMNKVFEPALYSSMKAKGYDLIPYVNFFGETPDKGWPEFFDSPRYSSGYASLWNCFGFTTETHMLKPFDSRVKATYALMECFIDFAAERHEEIRMKRKTDETANIHAQQFPVAWENDTTTYAPLLFKGYEAGKKPSAVSGLPRLYYDRNKPFEKTVNFYNIYKPVIHVSKPEAYVIPQGWWRVLDRLQLNGVKMKRLERDTSIGVEVYHVQDYKTSTRAYESHYPHSNVSIQRSTQHINFRKGDYYIPMNQAANRFITEVLEPQSNDSYFAWNFFDGILTRKEGFSDYVFEDTAAEMLRANAEMKRQLEQRKQTDTAFAKSASAQLEFIFRNSPYYEPEHLRYPVYRVMKSL